MSSDITLDFKKLKQVAGIQTDVLPIVVQHAETKEVLILAYVNKTALKQTQVSGYAVFWSTSRDELWEKGKTSGNRLKVSEIKVNCDENSLVFLVIPENEGVCHTKDETGQYRKSCYYRAL